MKKISPILFRLVSFLNDLEIHSGESLAKATGISRNAVWKHIQQLLKYELPIESFSGKGYRLKEPLNLLDLSALLAFQKNHNEGLPIHEIRIYGSIASSNDEVRILPRPPENYLQCCFAEHQTQGRGRFDRKWVSPFGKNLMLSIRLLINRDMSTLGGLSLVVSLAIRQTLENIGIHGACCKWPNDIYYGDKKLSGVLIEAYAESYGLTELVIGIGLNVNMTHQTVEDIEKPWTSLQEISSKLQDRSTVGIALIRNLSAYLARFLEKGFEDFQAEWAGVDYLKDQFIHLKIGAQAISGLVTGIDHLGHLKLLESSGQIKSYSAGEASFQG